MAEDHVIQEGPWQFNQEVTDVFDEMLQRSIPQYEVMRKLVFDVGSTFVKPQTCILDLGCSRGEAMAPFIDRFGAYNRFIGIERSAPMLEVARKRFAGLMATKTVEILDYDLRHRYPPVSASLTLSVLTLQFIPIEYRQRILANVFGNTVSGGAFIMVEKVLGSDSRADQLLVAHYDAFKYGNGYSQEEVVRKKMALEGVLVPVTSRWNKDLLDRAGFDHVECFWRCLNFCAWVAIKD